MQIHKLASLATDVNVWSCSSGKSLYVRTLAQAGKGRGKVQAVHLLFADGEKEMRLEGEAVYSPGPVYLTEPKSDPAVR